MKTNFQRTNFFLILTFGAMLIGFAPIFVKWSTLSSSAISFYRMLLAIPFLFLLNYALNRRFRFTVKNKKTILYAAIASLAFTTDCCTALLVPNLFTLALLVITPCPPERSI